MIKVETFEAHEISSAAPMPRAMTHRKRRCVVSNLSILSILQSLILLSTTAAPFCAGRIREVTFMKYLSALALAAALFAPVAHAEETLVFAAGTPPQGPIHEAFVEWVAAINADGAGNVQIDYREGFTMATPQNFYDRVKDGVVEMSWGTLTAIGGRFPLSSVVELPWLTDDAKTASVAFWRMTESGIMDQEFHDIVPLMTLVFPQSAVHLRAPIASLDSLTGQQVIAGTQTNAAVVSALGGTPLSIGLAESFEAIQRGTADGRLLPWSAFPAFRLAEITNFHIEAPVGTVVGAVFISRDVWEGLSQEAREIIMRHSGEGYSRATGARVDAVQAGIRAGIANNPAHTIVSISPEQEVAWQGRLASVTESWTAQVAGGAEFLDAYRAAIEAVGAEN
jgi:TRAP-type C4-dicarboxylate transport system substrate-binding protein